MSSTFTRTICPCCGGEAVSDAPVAWSRMVAYGRKSIKVDLRHAELIEVFVKSRPQGIARSEAIARVWGRSDKDNSDHKASFHMALYGARKALRRLGWRVVCGRVRGGDPVYWLLPDPTLYSAAVPAQPTTS